MVVSIASSCRRPQKKIKSQKLKCKIVEPLRETSFTEPQAAGVEAIWGIKKNEAGSGGREGEKPAPFIMNRVNIKTAHLLFLLYMRSCS